MTDPVAFTFRGSSQAHISEPVYPGAVHRTLDAYLGQHHGKFRLGRVVNGKVIDYGPWRTRADAVDHFAVRIAGESKPGSRWHVANRYAWTLSVTALSYTPGMRVLAAATTQIGVPYVFGAESPGHAFDCSGLSAWAWSTVGVELPHNAAEQQHSPNVAKVPVGEPGALVFMHVDGESVETGHVGVWHSPGFVIDTRHPVTEPVALRAIFNLTGYGMPHR